MERVITVKGTGRYSAKPDIITVTMQLISTDKDYEKAMSDAQTQIEELRSAALMLSFKREDIKTTSFSVDSEYENERNADGSVKRVFKGYRVSHGLKLEFDLDTKLLAKVLAATAKVNPELYISFGIKDKDAASKLLLENAAKNAKEKATVLTAASGEKLGRLLKIDYNWNEVSFVSNTDYRMEARCMSVSADARGVDIEPDSVEVTDTVAFTWELI